MQFKHSQQFRGQPHQQIENQKLQTYYAFMGQCRNKQIPTDEVNMNLGYNILLGFPDILFYRYIHNTHTHNFKTTFGNYVSYIVLAALCQSTSCPKLAVH